MENFVEAFSRILPILFLPPYSPDLNPIENFFSDLKTRVRTAVLDRMGQDTSDLRRKQLTDSIHAAIEGYPRRNFALFVGGTWKYLRRALLSQSFHALEIKE